MGEPLHEVRIHGVAGTTPSAMLSRDAGARVVRRISYTDRLTGFFAPEHPDPEHPAQVEAYSWGGLNSSAGRLAEKAKRVGWLILLPFALTNLAYWSRPDIDLRRQPTGAASRTATAVAVRWAALLITMAFTAAMCLLSMDLLAWQCFRGGSLVCSLPGWVPMAGAVEVLGSPTWDSPSRRLLLASLPPLVVIAGLWGLSAQTRRRYEAVPDHRARGQGMADGDPALDGDVILRRERMWQGEERLGRQQRIHLTAAVSVVVAAMSWPILSDAPGGVGAVLLWCAAGLDAAAALLVFAAAMLSVRDGNEFSVYLRGSDRLRTRRADAAATVGMVAVLAAAGTAGAAAFWPLDGAAVNEARDYFDGSLMIGALFLALAALVVFCAFASRSARLAGGLSIGLVAVSAVGLVAVDREPGSLLPWLAGGAAVPAVVALAARAHGRVGGGTVDGQAWRGAAPAMILGAATAVAMLYTVALLVGAATLLNGDRPVTAIVAGYPADTAPTAAVLGADGTPEPPRELRSSGPVEVSGGVVLLGPGRTPVVADGRIAVGQLWTAGQRALQLPGVMLGQARIDSGADRLLLRQTCLAPLGADIADCAGGSFVDTGSLPLPEGMLAVRAERGVPVDVADPPQAPIVLPSALLWAATLLVPWVVGVLVVVVASWLRFRRAAGPALRAQLDEDASRAPMPGAPGIEPDDVPRCAAARQRAAMTHRAERVLGRVAVVSGAVFLILVAGGIYGRPPWQQLTWLRPLGDLGLYAALVLGLGLLWFLSRVRTSDRARRSAGVLFDIVTFWPRAAHPFGPPSYGERVVPEVTRRVRAILRQTHGEVVLSGHSQGSVIAVAVASRLDDQRELPRLYLLTHGSQLRAWFGRIFPAVLGPGQLGIAPVLGAWSLDEAWPDAGTGAGRLDGGPVPADSLRGRLQGRWVNLFRRTDPIGFRVFGDLDAPLGVPLVGDVPVCELDERYDLATHGGYQFTPEYLSVLRAWAERSQAAQ